MKKEIIIGGLVVVLIGVGSMVYFSQEKGDQRENKVISSECSNICEKAANTCPSIINKNSCENKCGSLNEETKKHLSDSTSCQELTAKPELIADLIIPEVNTPDKINSSNDCEMACSNYSVKCLSLVPGASQEVYNEGLLSCMSECKKWNGDKTGCMINAIDCEAMTNVCGL